MGQYYEILEYLKENIPNSTSIRSRSAFRDASAKAYTIAIFLTARHFGLVDRGGDESGW